MEDVPGGVPTLPPKFQSDRMHGKIVILFSFLLVGKMGVAAQPAHLVEDVPGSEAYPPTKFQPDCCACEKISFGQFFACGHGLRPRPQATPTPPT